MRLTGSRLHEVRRGRRPATPPASPSRSHRPQLRSDYGAGSKRCAPTTLAVGTSAIRDAENGEAFLGEVEWSYGFTTRLLSGDEERLAHVPRRHLDRELEPGGRWSSTSAAARPSSSPATASRSASTSGASG